eukprot:gene418-755_t
MNGFDTDNVAIDVKEDTNLSMEQIPDTNNFNDEECAVCMDGTSYEDNEIIFCDKCNVPVHCACYGVKGVPEGAWFCDVCAHGGNPTTTKCELCPNLSGAYKATERPGLWVHCLCAMWIPEIYCTDNSSMSHFVLENLYADKARFRLKCAICNTKRGACIQCAHGRCTTSAHPSCALNRKSGYTHRIIRSEDYPGACEWEIFCVQHSRSVKDAIKPKCKAKRGHAIDIDNNNNNSSNDNNNSNGNENDEEFDEINDGTGSGTDSKKHHQQQQRSTKGGKATQNNKGNSRNRDRDRSSSKPSSTQDTATAIAITTGDETEGEASTVRRGRGRPPKGPGPGSGPGRPPKKSKRRSTGAGGRSRSSYGGNSDEDEGDQYAYDGNDNDDDDYMEEGDEVWEAIPPELLQSQSHDNNDNDGGSSSVYDCDDSVKSQEWPGQAIGEAMDLEHFWNVASMMYPEDHDAKWLQYMTKPLFEKVKDSFFRPCKLGPPPALSSSAKENLNKLLIRTDELYQSVGVNEKDRLAALDSNKRQLLLETILRHTVDMKEFIQLSSSSSLSTTGSSRQYANAISDISTDTASNAAAATTTMLMTSLTSNDNDNTNNDNERTTGTGTSSTTTSSVMTSLDSLHITPTTTTTATSASSSSEITHSTIPVSMSMSMSVTTVSDSIKIEETATTTTTTTKLTAIANTANSSSNSGVPVSDHIPSTLKFIQDGLLDEYLYMIKQTYADSNSSNSTSNLEMETEDNSSSNKVIQAVIDGALSRALCEFEYRLPNNINNNNSTNNTSLEDDKGGGDGDGGDKDDNDNESKNWMSICVNDDIYRAGEKEWLWQYFIGQKNEEIHNNTSINDTSTSISTNTSDVDPNISDIEICLNKYKIIPNSESVLLVNGSEIIPKNEDDEICRMIRADSEVYKFTMRTIHEEINKLLQLSDIKNNIEFQINQRKEWDKMQEKYIHQLIWKKIAIFLIGGMKDQEPDFNKETMSVLPASWTINVEGRPKISEEKLKISEKVKNDEDLICVCCFNGNSIEGNEILYCDGCNSPMHQSCYGISEIPEGDFFCNRCRIIQQNYDELHDNDNGNEHDINDYDSMIRNTRDFIKCCLCPAYHGGLKPTTDGRYVHLCCAWWSGRAIIDNLIEMEPVDISHVPATSIVDDDYEYGGGGGSGSGKNRRGDRDRSSLRSASKRRSNEMSDMPLPLLLSGQKPLPLSDTPSVFGIEFDSNAAGGGGQSEQTVSLDSLDPNHIVNIGDNNNKNNNNNNNGGTDVVTTTGALESVIEADNSATTTTTNSMTTSTSTVRYCTFCNLRGGYLMTCCGGGGCGGDSSSSSSCTTSFHPICAWFEGLYVRTDVIDPSFCQFLDTRNTSSSPSSSTGSGTGIPYPASGIAFHFMCDEHCTSTSRNSTEQAHLRGKYRMNVLDLDHIPGQNRRRKRKGNGAISTTTSGGSTGATSTSTSGRVASAIANQVKDLEPDEYDANICHVCMQPAMVYDNDYDDNDGNDGTNSDNKHENVKSEGKEKTDGVAATKNMKMMLLQCQVCKIKVHPECYPQQVVDTSTLPQATSKTSTSTSSTFRCQVCIENDTDPRCSLCPRRGGAFLHTDDDRWAHVYCGRYAPGMTRVSSEGKVEIRLIPKELKKQKCSMCNRKTGACVRCKGIGCSALFHPLCGYMSGKCYLAVRHGIKEIYCPQHIPPTIFKLSNTQWIDITEIQKLRTNMDSSRNLIDVILQREKKKLALYRIENDSFQLKMKLLRDKIKKSQFPSLNHENDDEDEVDEIFEEDHIEDDDMQDFEVELKSSQVQVVAKKKGRKSKNSFDNGITIYKDDLSEGKLESEKDDDEDEEDDDFMPQHKRIRNRNRDTTNSIFKKSKSMKKSLSFKTDNHQQQSQSHSQFNEYKNIKKIHSKLEIGFSGQYFERDNILLDQNKMNFEIEVKDLIHKYALTTRKDVGIFPNQKAYNDFQKTLSTHLDSYLLMSLKTAKAAAASQLKNERNNNIKSDNIVTVSDAISISKKSESNRNNKGINKSIKKEENTSDIDDDEDEDKLTLKLKFNNKDSKLKLNTRGRGRRTDTTNDNDDGDDESVTSASATGTLDMDTTITTSASNSKRSHKRKSPLVEVVEIEEAVAKAAVTLSSLSSQQQQQQQHDPLQLVPILQKRYRGCLNNGFESIFQAMNISSSSTISTSTNINTAVRFIPNIEKWDVIHHPLSEKDTGKEDDDSSTTSTSCLNLLYLEGQIQDSLNILETAEYIPPKQKEKKNRTSTSTVTEPKKTRHSESKDPNTSSSSTSKDLLSSSTSTLSSTPALASADGSRLLGAIFNNNNDNDEEDDFDPTIHIHKLNFIVLRNRLMRHYYRSWSAFEKDIYDMFNDVRLGKTAMGEKDSQIIKDTDMLLDIFKSTTTSTSNNSNNTTTINTTNINESGRLYITSYEYNENEYSTMKEQNTKRGIDMDLYKATCCMCANEFIIEKWPLDIKAEENKKAQETVTGSITGTDGKPKQEITMKSSRKSLRIDDRKAKSNTTTTGANEKELKRSLSLSSLQWTWCCPSCVQLPSSVKRLLNRAVQVWWKDDNTFYTGHIELFEPITERYKILYDDNDWELLSLCKEPVLIEKRTSTGTGSGSDNELGIVDDAADALPPVLFHKACPVSIPTSTTTVVSSSASASISDVKKNKRNEITDNNNNHDTTSGLKDDNYIPIRKKKKTSEDDINIIDNNITVTPVAVAVAVEEEATILDRSIKNELPVEVEEKKTSTSVSSEDSKINKNKLTSDSSNDSNVLQQQPRPVPEAKKVKGLDISMNNFNNNSTQTSKRSFKDRNSTNSVSTSSVSTSGNTTNSNNNKNTTVENSNSNRKDEKKNPTRTSTQSSILNYAVKRK